jgi:hypothetical protein
MKHDFKLFFDYLPWNEAEISGTLQSVYNWETETNTKTTWRIGDGTSAFYNYLYLRLCGFTENDTFRSNQIRHNVITREYALNQIKIDNAIRLDAIKFYADTIGFHLDTVVDRIEQMAEYK